jgi:hypothetical protein
MTDAMITPITLESLTAWVLACMVKLLNPAMAHGLNETDHTVHHWEESYPSTAQAIAVASLEAPLFKGETGPQKTAAVLTALAWHESRFDVNAVGDHGQARGLYQVHPTTVPDVEEDMLNEALPASRTARELIRQSQRICRGYDIQEQLGWYAAGSNGCQEAGRKKSRVRMNLAMRLMKEPLP